MSDVAAVADISNRAMSVSGNNGKAVRTHLDAVKMRSTDVTPNAHSVDAEQLDRDMVFLEPSAELQI